MMGGHITKRHLSPLLIALVTFSQNGNDVSSLGEVRPSIQTTQKSHSSTRNEFGMCREVHLPLAKRLNCNVPLLTFRILRFWIANSAILLALCKRGE